MSPIGFTMRCTGFLYPEVQKLMTKGNQVVVVAKPQRYGLQILHLDKKRIRPANEDEALLFQMITPEGDEIDHAVF